MTKDGKFNVNEEARIYDHESRISKVEENIGGIKDSIHLIENNHLKHIEADVSTLKSNYAKLRGEISATVGIVTALVTIAMDLISKWFFK